MIFTNHIINWMLLNAQSVLDFIGKLEKYLFENNITKDIFYQNYNPKKLVI